MFRHYTRFAELTILQFLDKACNGYFTKADILKRNRKYLSIFLQSAKHRHVFEWFLDRFQIKKFFYITQGNIYLKWNQEYNRFSSLISKNMYRLCKYELSVNDLPVNHIIKKN